MVDVSAGAPSSGRPLTGEGAGDVSLLLDDAPRRVREVLDRAGYSGPQIAKALGVGGLPLDLAVDTDVANLLVRCDGSLPLRELLARTVAATGVPADTVARNGAAATRHLIEAGFLLPR